MNAAVFCLGIATLDYVYSVDAMPARAEKYRARDLAVSGGGCAGNASVAIARLGGRARLATRLGDDLTGRSILADLRAEGVDVRHARRFAGLRSPVSAILVDSAGERTVVSYSDPGIPVDPGWLPERLPRGTRAVLVDTRWGEGAFAGLALARDAGVPGVLDADRRPPHPELLPTASHVAFSAQALRETAGIDDPERALLALSGGLSTWLAVTLGREGVLFVEKGKVAHVPAFEVKAVDTLGAGDVWHGAFALALAEGQSERGAIRFANAVAALKCTRFGGRAGSPTRAEAEAFLADAAA